MHPNYNETRDGLDQHGVPLPLTRTSCVSLIAACTLAITACGNDPPESATQASSAAPSEPERPFRYDVEYPSIGYSNMPSENRIARLGDSLDSGAVELEYRGNRGYLDSLLDALEIDLSSQILVFSATSLQAEGIRPDTPRAIYFNDDTYVAYVQGAGALEIATVDTRLGPVFYTLDQDAQRPVPFERRIVACLRCHDSYSLTGGGAPRFIVGSGYIGREGQLVSHEGWILTTDATPLRFRWGGWYVTGFHGEQVHLGNFAVGNVEQLEQLEQLRTGNISDLRGLFDTSPYPTHYSDIVALLVFWHQTRAQNVMTRVNYDLRTLRSSGAATTEDGADRSTGDAIAEITEPLVNALLMTDAAEISSQIEGTSGFSEHFSSRGPRDSAGRSLRDLNLRDRLFEYPLSYLIYSDAFDALDPEAHRYLYRRLDQILSGDDSSPEFAHLSTDLRLTLRQILIETKPEFAAYVRN